MSFDDYIRNKHTAEMRRTGHIEVASVVIAHEHHSCKCDGINPRCRFVTGRKWVKSTNKQKGE